MAKTSRKRMDALGDVDVDACEAHGAGTGRKDVRGRAADASVWKEGRPGAQAEPRRGLHHCDGRTKRSSW